MTTTIKRFAVIPMLLTSIFCLAKGESEFKAGNQSSQFIANTGQITDQHYHLRKDIDAKIEANGVTMFVGSGQLHYQWTAPPDLPQGEEINSVDKVNRDVNNAVLSPWGRDREGLEIYRLDVTLVGANPNAEVIFEEPTGYYENYYLAHTGETGVTAKGYSRVIYKDIYPGIDWVIYSSPIPTFPQGERGGNFDNPQVSPLGGDLEGAGSRGIKYDFIVHPGADPSLIRLRYDGTTDLQIKDGTLIATTPFGNITEEVPYTYQSADNKEIPSHYILEGNTLSFGLGQYTGKLVIDPTLNWATYYGGSFEEQLERIGVDDGANVYLSGWTQSNNNIATTGAFNTTAISNDWNMYVAKFNSSGVRQWGTYFADTGYISSDAGYATADRHGNVYLTGGTHTVSGIATSGAHQTTLQGPSDGYMMKFNTAGQRIWGTYFGGSGTDVLGAVHVSAQDEIIVGAGTGSATGIATSGTYKPNYHVNNGYCLLKFDSSGQQIWGTYTNFGGEIATDIYGNIYIASGTQSDTGIATNGAHQTIRVSTGNFESGILVKFDSTGNRLWGTYYGGAGGDRILSVVVPSPDEIYISGLTGSTNNIASTGSFNATMTGTSAGFLAKFNSNGVRQWGTYYNGTYYGLTTSDMVNGDIIVAGMSQTSGLATTGAYKTTIGGSTDGFWARFTPSGQRTYATYFGGSGNDLLNFAGNKGHSVAIAGKYLYLCGVTYSTTGLATNGAHQNTYGGFNDAFLMQFELEDTLVSISNQFSTLHACTTDSLYVPVAVTRNFGSGNTFRVQLSNAGGSFSSPTTLAIVSSTMAGTIPCYLPVSIPAGTGYKLRVIATVPADTSQPSADMAIYGYPAAFSSGSNSPLCSGKDLQLNSGTTTTGVTFAWAGPGSYNSSLEDPLLTNANVAMSGDYYITVDHNGCVVKDTVTVVVNQTPENVTAGADITICTGDTMKLTSSTTTGGVTYAWTGANNYNTQNVNKTNVQLTDSGWYLVTVSLGNCSDTASTHVSVDRSATINMAPTTGTDVCVGSTAQFTSFVQYAGTNPQLQWMVNGVDVSGATNQNFSTTTLNNGDKVSVKVTANTTCPGTRTSNEVTMTVQPKKTPSVSITANPNTSLFPNQPVTFTATPTDAGANPTYQWKRNGANVGGATSATWGANANFLDNNDDICVLITSDYVCPDPDTALSNCIKLQIRVGIDDVDNNNNINIYPNPTKNNITILSSTKIETIEITNLLGQQMHAQTTTAKTVEVDMNHLPAGVYIIKVNGTYVVRVVKE